MSSAQRWTVTAALGASVIAVCYGFGRYAYGLFVPQFAVDFALNATGLGLLGGVSTLGYTLGLLAAPRLAGRSARTTAIMAGACAAIGLMTMSVSELLPVFACGLLIAGASAGLVSPAVAELITYSVSPGVRAQAQTWANTGTSFGLTASAFTPVLVFGWRETWLGFGLIASAITIMALIALPKLAGRNANTPVAGPLLRPGLMPLLVNSVLLGLTSAPYWNFSVERVVQAGLSDHFSAWFWLTIGIAGPLGGVAGGLCHRYGLTRANLVIWSVWAIGLVLLALPSTGPVISLISASIFGATFMALTGICILWAALLFTESPARGVTLSFFGLGVGQTLGSPIAGALADHIGLPAVFFIAAVMSLTAWYQLHSRMKVNGLPADR
ncbi:MFS transporter [Nesterenkonia ebinurensis]|uniref:MFS transporter n=1 Tax=Nesterenkonia ebinurensis TaxID=2608252 RepID=UPI00123E3C93|nr:MFS transporter [Nesterenkonia ebinurensis]